MGDLREDSAGGGELRLLGRVAGAVLQERAAATFNEQRVARRTRANVERVRFGFRVVSPGVVGVSQAHAQPRLRVPVGGGGGGARKRAARRHGEYLEPATPFRVVLIPALPLLQRVRAERARLPRLPPPHARQAAPPPQFPSPAPALRIQHPPTPSHLHNLRGAGHARRHPDQPAVLAFSAALFPLHVLRALASRFPDLSDLPQPELPPACLLAPSQPLANRLALTNHTDLLRRQRDGNRTSLVRPAARVTRAQTS